MLYAAVGNINQNPANLKPQKLYDSLPLLLLLLSLHKDCHDESLVLESKYDENDDDNDDEVEVELFVVVLWKPPREKPIATVIIMIAKARKR